MKHTIELVLAFSFLALWVAVVALIVLGAVPLARQARRLRRPRARRQSPGAAERGGKRLIP